MYCLHARLFIWAKPFHSSNSRGRIEECCPGLEKQQYINWHGTFSLLLARLLLLGQSTSCLHVLLLCFYAGGHFLHAPSFNCTYTRRVFVFLMWLFYATRRQAWILKKAVESKSNRLRSRRVKFNVTQISCDESATLRTLQR